MIFSDVVESELNKRFAKEVQTAARGALPAEADLPFNAPYERILVAIIGLSSGDVNRLSHFSDRARKDWRDVLYWAESLREKDEPKSWDELKARLLLQRKTSDEPRRTDGEGDK